MTSPKNPEDRVRHEKGTPLKKVTLRIPEKLAEDAAALDSRSMSLIATEALEQWIARRKRRARQT
ncbi:uncharacterized Zn finger protein (UPF0148 family) [Kitasatospora sp. MAP12-15]|uniref:hypothetical protein n=1 Tax=unclassified Kitasatospora TaxID=2633591 RepID=UPI0024758FC8|nr:hypothetical protein [Kitasatospora sp. MAP12-44]MDH6110223.1 uncharacterized Zn finger protein (UPF0148 family) [Kitasatospora sp. MAP12-44]